MYICICHAITERQVRACVDAGAASLGDLQFELGVATGCGRCAGAACEYLPGGCSNVCEVRDATMSVSPAGMLAESGQAAHGFPIPIPVVAV